MEVIQRTGFTVVGLKITTTNAEAMKEGSIAKAWDDFFSKGIFDLIPNKIDDRLFAVYHNFEEKFTDDNMNKSYDLIIGCKVENTEGIKKWLHSCEVPEQKYAKFIAKGDLPYAVIGTWKEIWNSKIGKNYTADFEVYSRKSQMGKNSEVDIYIGVK